MKKALIFSWKMKVQIDKERKWDNIQGKRETETSWYFVKKIGIYVKWMREEFEIKILIYWLYKLALHSRLLAGIIQSWGFSVCFILVLSQSFHSHYTERALIFCLWSSKWKLMKKFSLILHFWGIYDIFFHLLSNLSLLKEQKG